MRNLTTTLANGLKTRRFFSSSLYNDALSSVPTVLENFDSIDVNKFRQKAFAPEMPLLMTQRNNNYSSSRPYLSIPAAFKWFSNAPGDHLSGPPSLELSQQYLALFDATILPYELHVDKRLLSEDRNNSRQHSHKLEDQELRSMLKKLVEDSHGTFHRFHAPLSLFLHAYRERSTSAYQLYIAQAQIADLPKLLQADLPTPTLVKEAGEGDIYDSNIWMGIPPTYTPLHKDPNPNLFIQLASSKVVRIFRPDIGAAIFRRILERIGQSASSSFRGEEMMEGPERDALDEAVWEKCTSEGFEATVSPGDALFIPKGWWHSIKSQGTDVTASVNWWFR